MSFISDFKTVIEGDSSVNALITGGIKYGHLPDDWDVKKSWCVWDYRMATQYDTLGANKCYAEYTIAVMITSTDSVKLNAISDLMIDYLNNKTTTNFIDIKLVSDSKLITLSKPTNTYQESLEFTATYVG